jgi:hypothetical protein
VRSSFIKKAIVFDTAASSSDGGCISRRLIRCLTGWLIFNNSGQIIKNRTTDRNQLNGIHEARLGAAHRLL